MIRDLLYREIAEVTGKPRLSWDYLFNHSYAEHRSGAILGSPQRQSVLSYLLRNLGDAERNTLFPGQFDIGSSQQPAKLTTEALIQELAAEGRGEARDSIRVIKEGIKDLTGIPFVTFFDQDKWGALKVLKLLFIVKTKNPVRIFSLLAPPGANSKPSMEVRDAHPLEGNERAACFISDLKALLCLEIDSARRDEIDQAFVQLIDRTNDITEQFIRSAFSASDGDYDTLLRLLNTLLDQLSAFKREEVPKKIAPLAETLYVHSCAVEFIHLTAATRFITTNLMPEREIAPLGSELRQLSRAIQGRQQASTNEECIPVSEFKDFVCWHEHDIRSALIKSMGEPVATETIKKATRHAEKLIRLWAVFDHPRGILTTIEDFDVSPLVALAALAAISHELTHPTRYHPYWLGQKNDRGNVLSALERVDLGSSVTKVAEEHITFWIRRLIWFKYAIAGQLDLLERREQVGELLINSFERLVQSYDIAAIRDHINGCMWLSNQLLLRFRK